MADVFKIAGSDDWHCKIAVTPSPYPRHQRVRLCSDKATSATWLRLLQNAADRKSAGEPPSPEKLAGIPRRCLEKVGLVSKVAAKRRAGWAEHVADYVAELKTRRLSALYIANAEHYLIEVGSACRWQTLSDATRDDMARFLQKRQEDGAGARTLNNIAATVKAFLTWAVDTSRTDSNELAKLKRVETTGDNRRKRRALSDDECRLLLGIKSEHHLCYRLALGTGLRRKELKLLEWRDVRIDGEDANCPRLELRAEATKARRADTLPLADDLAIRLRAARPAFVLPTTRVFKRVPSDRRWIADRTEAKIDAKDKAGRLAGFHSLRMSYITNLQKAGLPPRVVMALARHTDWRITNGVYTDMQLIDVFGAVKRLPDYCGPDAGELRKLGTNDMPAVPDQIRDQKGAATVHNGAQTCSGGGSANRTNTGKNADNSEKGDWAARTRT